MRIYGSGWDRKAAPNIPDDGTVDVLVTHGPPHGVLDGGYGDKWLRDDLLKVLPRVHLFGHVHECAGVRMWGADEGKGETEGESGGRMVAAVNAALANDGMRASSIVRPCRVVDFLP